MKKVLTVTALIAMAALVGCKKSEEGGRGEETFRVVVPAMSADVKQGEVQTVRVSVERGAGFKQGIKLEMEGPTGLKVDPASTLVKPGDKADVQLTIAAADDAPLGNQTIRVRGTPDKGEAVEIELKVVVIAK